MRNVNKVRLRYVVIRERMNIHEKLMFDKIFEDFTEYGKL